MESSQRGSQVLTGNVQEHEEDDAIQRGGDSDVVERRVQADVLAKRGEHQAALQACQQESQAGEQYDQPHRLPPLRLG